MTDSSSPSAAPDHRDLPTGHQRAATAADGPAGDQATDPRRWKVLAVCLSAGFVTLLDVSIVNVAMPSIQHSLHASATSLQLVVAGYTLAFGLVLVPAGRLGDAGSRRFLFVGGLVAFAVASLAAGLSPTDEWLAVARLFQGACAGLVSPQITGMIQQEFRGYERARAFGMFGATVGVATAVGPLLGGVIIQVFGEDSGWRWVFGINVPIIAVVLVAALRVVPRGTRGRRAGLDPGGLVLVALTTVAVMVPFVTTTGTGDDPARWWWLLVAALGAVATIGWERREARVGRDPVLAPDVLRLRSFRFGSLLGLAYFAGFTSVFLVVTLYLQDGLGLSALQAGLVGLPFAIASGTSALLSGRAVARWGRPLVVVGLVVVVIGLVGTDTAIRVIDAQPGDAALVCVVVACTQCVAGAGSGLVIAPNQTLTLAEVPVRYAGVAGSMLQVGQRIGSAIGISAVLSMDYGALASGASQAEAVGKGLLVTVGLVLVALVIAVLDARVRSRDPAESST
ncbi:MFS transporter [Luteimicrobium subarcticum]|uniref:EmrB/QacA subfamily drug resistance transporter n=1 Tax=Luteimicrobium subarcticum TaxID=620910 RepID=A0A2M8WR28_9MICO|nr:MFS transporter [Luteimicrobium subarcticum]PJI93354.1 EmrB/QacA subfamily drug resistance transporter [Luteimicrobium subarcticum]